MIFNYFVITTTNSKNITDFVPKNLLSSRKIPDWEQAIFAEHQNFGTKSPEDAKTEYLTIVKSWGYYGSTFYPPCKSIGSSKIPHSKVVIGVNYEGIRLLKPKTKVFFLNLLFPFPFIKIFLRNSNLFLSIFLRKF